MDYFKNWAVSSRLWLLVLVIAGGVLFVLEFNLGQSAMDITEQHVYEAERNQVKIAVDLIEVFEQSKREEVARFSRLFESYFPAPITADTKSTSIVDGRAVPTLRLRGKSLHLDYTTPDRFASQSGEAATIFAKAGDDFVRISTSLKKRNGERAVGTWLKRSHPSYKLLLAGKKYAGLATLFGTEYMTEYLPILNALGEVIGVKFVGVDVTQDVASLKSKLGSIKIGKTGHLYALHAEKGPKLGTLVFHPTSEGQNILEQRDINGRAYVKEMLATKSGTARIALQDANDKATSMLVAYDYIDERNWLIVAQVPEKEMLGDITKLRHVYAAISVGAILVLACILMTVIISMRRDLAERKRVERALQLSARVFSDSREGITITDSEGTIVDVNKAFTRITGYSREEALGQNPKILKSGRHPQEFYDEMWQAITKDGSWSGQIWNRKKSGEIYASLLSISTVYDEQHGTQNYIAFFSDITYMKDYEQELKQMAHYDVLTGLLSRSLLEDRLQQAIAQSQRSKTLVAIAYIDLDGFKEVNDRYGHAAGDELLVLTAQRMKSVLRGVDSLVRIGGDEFVAILTNVDNEEDSEQILNRMLQAVAEDALVGNTVMQISASIGVTICQDSAQDIDALVSEADYAMYKAKQSGKNGICFFKAEGNI